MTLRDEIKKNRREFWRDADSTQMGEELELIIDRIDGMDDKIYKIESELVNLNLRMDSVEFVNSGATIKLRAPATSEPFPGYNDFMEEVILAIKAALAEKRRELHHKVRPMTEDDKILVPLQDIPSYDLSDAHDFTGPREDPED